MGRAMGSPMGRPTESPMGGPMGRPMERPMGCSRGSPRKLHKRRTSGRTKMYKEDAFLRIPFCSGNASMALPLRGSLRLEEDLFCFRFEVFSQIFTARPGALTDTREVHRILPLFSTLRHRYRHFRTMRNCTRTPHKGRTRAPYKTPTQGLRTKLHTKSP